jgi:hypothetical protein
MKKIILLLLMALPIAGFAEDSITNTTWKSSIALGATYKTGNTEQTLFTLNMKADQKAPTHDWMNSLYAEQGKTGGKQTQGQVRGQSNYRHMFGQSNFFGGWFAEAYTDSIKQIRTRIKTGPDLGYYFVRTKKMTFDVSAGLNAVYERTATTEDSYAECRLATHFVWNFVDNASYYFTAEYSADVEDTNNGSGLLVTGLKNKVNEHLSMFIELRDEYDNIVSSSKIDHNDLTIMAGIGYDF